MSLILHPTYELYEKKEKPFCSSLQVAQSFGKQHKNVIADIRNLDCSEHFNRLNFQPVKYTDEKGEKRPMFLMTKNGFIFLVMGYRGKKAAIIKKAYIERFDAMENFIRDYILSKKDFPAFTQAIMDAHDEPKTYHYSNECNMIYRIVLGMDAKHFRELHGLNDGDSIRPYLTDAQAKAVRKLQIEDIRLLFRGAEFMDRKEALGSLFSARRLTA